MPVTFVTYTVGMLALSGFPLLFSGFWSKDEILHAAHGWAGVAWAVLPRVGGGVPDGVLYDAAGLSGVFWGVSGGGWKSEGG